MLSLISACGVLLIALAHSSARYDVSWAQPLYWLGLLVVYVPLTTRLIVPGVSRQEAIGSLVFLGLAAYLIKLLQSPLGYTFFDEFLHWRTANDIMRHGVLFKENSLLPVSPLYPGLELVTVAVASLTGLNIFWAGVLVVASARVVLMLALYLFYEQVTGSVRVAGIATALYMSNSHFVIFDAQFAYESLSIGLFVTVMLAVVYRQRTTGSEHYGINLTIIMLLATLMPTHHATSYVTIGFLALWAAVMEIYKCWIDGRHRAMVWIVAVAIAMNATWLFSVATITVGYLAPHLQGAVTSILSLMSGEGSDRELFKSSSGIVTPMLEKAIGLGAPLLSALGLGLGIFAYWKRYRLQPTATMLMIVSMAYPVTMVMRLTGGGWEISARAAVFVLFPLSYAIAIGIEHLDLPWWIGWLKRPLEIIKVPLFAVFAGVLFCGGIIAGWSPWARMPWPYQVGADTRSVEPQGLAAAYWASSYLGPDNRMAADRINMTLMGTYGEQRLITDLIDHVSISGIFLATHLGPNEYEALRKGQIRYLVVDNRISTSLPLDGHYYESWEKMIVAYTGPVNAAILNKFDTMPGVQQVLDTGDIHIYDVGALLHEP